MQSQIPASPQKPSAALKDFFARVWAGIGGFFANIPAFFKKTPSFFYGVGSFFRKIPGFFAGLPALFMAFLSRVPSFFRSLSPKAIVSIATAVVLILSLIHI